MGFVREGNPTNERMNDMSKQNYSSYIRSLEKARMVLAEKRAQQKASQSVLEAAKELADLYVERAHIEDKISALEAKLSAMEPKKQAPTHKRSKPNPANFQTPTLDILSLVPEKGTVTRQQVYEHSRKVYGNRYSYGAVSSSLYRLAKAGTLAYDGKVYSLPKK